LELQEGTVVADRVGETPCVFLAGLHRAERTIAERLTRLANDTLPWPWIDPDKALPWSACMRAVGNPQRDSFVSS
jgi:exodeoxyribonuclease V alpha subunit